MTDDHGGEYYWCLTHHRVEPYDGCKAADRLGPYKSPEEAQHALEHAEARNEAWETDPTFNDLEEEEEKRKEREEGAWGPFRI